MLSLLALGVQTILSTGRAEAACATGASVQTWSCYEIPLVASRTYSQPIRDLRIRVAFSRPGSQPVTVSAFWDGGPTYRARVALPDAGTWTYLVSTNDPASGLDSRAGTVTAVSYTGPDPYRNRGWLSVSANRRYLTYADGTPFFWLADTAWEMPWASTGTQVPAYMANRQQKNFNIVQVVTNSHQLFYPSHIRNRDGAGDPYLLNNDHSLLNPAYFARLDSIVAEANDRHLAVAMVPLWGTFAEPHYSDPDNGHGDTYTLAEARLHARYVGARYAGHNVIWIVGGDRDYFTEEKRAYWDAFARDLRDASGGRHIMSVHSGGYSGSFNSWPIPPDWMDLHMYQAGHYADIRYDSDGQNNPVDDSYGSLLSDGGYHWRGGLIGYSMEQHIPVLNEEANYENLLGRFWDFFGTTGGLMIEDVHVRNAAYWGLHSGSTVGYSYGANGVWQWTTVLEPGGGNFRAHHVAMESLDFPAAFQMTSMRAYAEANSWYEWVPAPERVREIDTEHFVAAATWGEALMVYAPQGSRSFTVQIPDTTAEMLALRWISPTTHAQIADTTSAINGRVALSAPDEADWLLMVRRVTGNPTVPEGPLAPEVRLRTEGPNPARSVRALLLSGPEGEMGHLDVVDVLGRQVYSETVVLRTVATRTVLPTLAPGVYLCRVTRGTRASSVLYRFTVTG